MLLPLLLPLLLLLLLLLLLPRNTIFLFNEERKTGGVVRKRLENSWLLHDETTTSIYENSAGF